MTIVRPTLASAAAALGALMPKCPLCLMAILGAFGVELPRVSPWLTPLAIVFLAIALGLTTWTSCRRRRWISLAFACLATVVILTGRISLRNDHVVRAGAVVFIGASLCAGRKSCDDCRHKENGCPTVKS